jgi:YD repeat-containing protein
MSKFPATGIVPITRTLAVTCTIVAALWLIPSAGAVDNRDVFDDSLTQAGAPALGNTPDGDLFGDRTDAYTGATDFLVTDVRLPGNSALSVAIQRSMKGYDDGNESTVYSLPNSFLNWSRFEVPYLTSIFKLNAGWVVDSGSGSTNSRCSTLGTPPTVTQSSGKASTFEYFEYWRGYQLYLPGLGTQELGPIVSPDPNAPTDGATYYWTTKDHWYFSCLSTTSNGVAGQGFLARAPNGDKYYFDWVVKWRTISPVRKLVTAGETVLQRNEYRILLRRVEDRFGNWVNYTYSGNDLSTITANDGRQLTLAYSAPGGQVTSVTDGTRLWTYDYSAGVQVTYPDSTVWKSSVTQAGIFRKHPTGCRDEQIRYGGQSVLSIQLRSGATGTFTFLPFRRGLAYVPDTLSLPCPSVSRYIDNIALSTKTISGTGLSGMTWTYSYGPANGCYTNQSADKCTASSPVTRYVDLIAPAGTFVRYTFGNRYQDTDAALQRVQTGASASAFIRDETISYQTFAAPLLLSGQYLDTIIRVPSSRIIVLDGASYSTTNSNWDVYQNPQTITETGPNGGSRTSQLTYYNNKTKWVIGEVASRSAPGSSMSKTFDANGSTATVTEDGVVTAQYTYTSEGNIATATYPRSLTYTYSSYKRGIAQSELQPDSVSLARTVSDAGFLLSSTDGEGRTTIYSRDAMGRPTFVDMPRGNDITINYSGLAKSTRTTTRGSLVATVTYDALWRPTSLVRAGITTSYQYDGYGRTTFVSNPGDSIGTQAQYDSLGRTTRITNPDSTFRTYSYGVATRSLTDERGRVTTQSYRAYGDPAKAYLMGIAAPVSSASVTVIRGTNDLVSSVTQGGVTRNLSYDSRNYLVSETNPEVGTITYGRDAAGNMSSRHVASSADTTYTYDGHNRTIGIQYPGGVNVTRTYSKTGRLLTAQAPAATRTLGYDQNDNLTSESLAVDGYTLAVQYGYNANDQISSITYPVLSRVVNLAPDVLGRPSQVSGYITSATWWPSGQVNQLTYANGVTSTYAQNARLWPSTFSTAKGGTSITATSYGYDSVGNITSISDGTDPSSNRTLDYDAIDRLTFAAGSWGSGTIAYDGAGNITSQGLGSWTLGYTYDSLNRLSSVFGSRLASFTYDVYGNITSDGTKSFSYDDAPNLRCADCGGTNRVDYAYDGLNRRVWSSKGGVKTYEFYDSSNSLLAEYTPTLSGKLVEYIYIAGKRIAQRTSP